MTTTTVGDQVVITIDHNDERIILTVKEYVKGKYTIDQSSTAATFNFTKSDISAAYTATISPDNYIELTNIHSDATKYDGKFSFTAIDKNFNVKNFSGSWINAKKY